jgi:tetratricopeptide (TPR) repeat protein
MSELKQDQKIQDLISARQFVEAETAIRARLENTPASADAHYLLGVMHYFKGNLRETVQSLREALKHDPRHTDAAICLSVLLNDIGRYDDAKNVFEIANQSVSTKTTGDDFEVDRKFAVKHLEIADLYFRYRRYDEAIDEYVKAASLDPFTFDIRIRLAKAYAKKGFVTRAIQELQQLKAENPRYIPARLQLGLLHYSQKNVLDAELEWETVLDLEADHREALAYLEMAKQSRGV